MPWDRKRYPADWDSVRKMILERAGYRCEFCGVPNNSIGARDKNGRWWDIDDYSNLQYDHGVWLFGDTPTPIRIVLTVAHVEHPDPHNCDPGNLAALCQRCHNQHDAPMRARHAAETRREKAGQTVMAL